MATAQELPGPADEDTQEPTGTSMGFEPMISLKRYLDGQNEPILDIEDCSLDALQAIVSAYRSALAEMGNAGFSACPVSGGELKQALAQIDGALQQAPILRSIQSAESSVRDLLRAWAKKTAHHYEQKGAEVKDLLLVMARSAESLGHKDERFAKQLDSVTSQLETIASLDDVSRIRASIQESSRELKASVARMVAESKAVIDHLRVEVSTYQAKLERAEHFASSDSLTGLGSRRWLEDRIQRRIDQGEPFSVVMIDIVDFRKINDEYGHLVGDMLLKEFARELRGACRFSDLVARWGGDEFIVVLDAAGSEARGQMARLHSWVSGPYHLPARPGQLNVRLEVSVGMAQYKPGDDLNMMLERADAERRTQRKLAQERKTA